LKFSLALEKRAPASSSSPVRRETPSNPTDHAETIKKSKLGLYEVEHELYYYSLENRSNLCQIPANRYILSILRLSLPIKITPLIWQVQMTEKNYSNYQQKLIKRFYQNRDAIALQRAQELVTELYLSEGKKREKVWVTLAKNLELAGVPVDHIAHLREKDDPALVAKILSEMV
jgi:hypothetical protein